MKFSNPQKDFSTLEWTNAIWLDSHTLSTVYFYTKNYQRQVCWISALMSGGLHQDSGVDGPAHPRQVHEPPGPPTLLRMGPPQLLVSIFSGSLTKDHSLICVFYLSNIGAYMNLLILQVFIELHTGQDSFYCRIRDPARFMINEIILSWSEIGAYFPNK